MPKIRRYFRAHPNHLLLLDAGGALFTTFVLFVMSVFCSAWVGIPATILEYLSLIACIICLYSTGSCLLVRRKFPTFILIAGLLNILYCVATIGVMYHYRSDLSFYGAAYFIAEVLVIFLLIQLEVKVAAAILNHN